MWGEYCVGESEGEERRGVRLMGGHAFVLQGGTAFVVKCILVNSWYQKR